MTRIIDAEHYPIYVGAHLLESDLWKSYWQNCQQKIVVCMDSVIYSLYKDKILHSFLNPPLIFNFPAGEIYKTRETKQMLEDAMFEAGCGRDTIIIAVGGGVTCDLVGFLASTFCRGIPVVYVPTTLMAMVDASIGGKTGVNISAGKNLIGHFSFPQSVWMSVDFLQTLTQEEFLSGMAEVIKHAIVSGEEDFDWLIQNYSLIIHRDINTLIPMIENSCQIKNNIVKHDAFETGLRQVLNFGHTLAHAIEVYEQYQWLHGYAVGLGIRIETYISMILKHLSINDVEKIKHILDLYGFTQMSSVLDDLDVLKALLKKDKKNKQDKIHVVLLDAIGKVHHEALTYSFSVSSDVLLKAIEWVKQDLC